MSRSGQIGIGSVLAALAGHVDALGFVRPGGLCTASMSGDTTQVAVFGAEAGLHRIVLPAVLTLAFLAGSIPGSGLAIPAPARWTTPTVLACEGLPIVGGPALGLQSPELAVASVFAALAMGSQNAVLVQVKGFRAGTTFVTGALFSLGRRIARALTRTGDPPGWVGGGPVWLSPLLGAVSGALAYDALGLYALIPPAGVVGSLAVVTATLIVCAGPPAAKV